MMKQIECQLFTLILYPKNCNLFQDGNFGMNCLYGLNLSPYCGSSHSECVRNQHKKEVLNKNAIKEMKYFELTIYMYILVPQSKKYSHTDRSRNMTIIATKVLKISLI